MDQITRDNEESDDGFAWPQVGWFLGQLMELQVGFSCTHPNVDKWEARHLEEFTRMYGPECVKFVQVGFDGIHAEYTKLYDAGKENEADDHFVAQFDVIRTEAIVLGEKFEQANVLL